MLNAEKFKEDILKNSNVISGFSISKDKHTIKKCLGVCGDCLFHEKGDHCSNIKIKWLMSEYKEPVKLSTLEHELLRHLYKKDYRYIAREKSERMFAYKGRPFKVFGHSWNIAHGEKLGFLNLYDFSYLFQFVNWEDEQPTSIKEVLNNCEVIDDESK